MICSPTEIAKIYHHFTRIKIVWSAIKRCEAMRAAYVRVGDFRIADDIDNTIEVLSAIIEDAKAERS